MAERKKRNKKHSIIWQLRWYLLFIAEIALVLSVFKLTKYKRETDASNAANEELAQAVTYNTAETQQPSAQSKDDTERLFTEAVSFAGADSQGLSEDDSSYFPITVDFDMLLSKNPDCVGWIYSEDTPINLAVMQGDDNTYYLYRVFDRTYNGYGTIFLDCNSSAGFTDANNLIFGHDMKNGTMFGSLRNYRNQDYFEKHPCMWLATEYRNYKLKVVAGLVHTDDSSIYVTPISRKATDELVPFAIRNSVFNSGATYDPNANYVTLSTCCDDFPGARLAIICEMCEITK